MAFGDYSVRSGLGIVKREATMNIRRVPFLVILIVILAQHAGMIILVGK